MDVHIPDVVHNKCQRFWTGTPSEHKTGCVKRTPVKPVGMVFEDFDVTNSISSEYIAAALRLKLLLSRWSIFFCMSLFSHPPKTVFNG
jgi:hypothetical protein